MTSVIELELTARQRGDFQTPEDLARQIWTTIHCSKFDLIIEPTFGLGSFLTTIPKDCSADVIGWEIVKDYYQATIKKVAGAKLHNGDVFNVTTDVVPVTHNSSVLVIGNPPWVTNAEQSVLGGKNTGAKQNLKSLTGLDALTGKANFDISEAIILQFVRILNKCKYVEFAMLAKFSVLRNLILFLSEYPNIGNFEFHKIDSAKHFEASVDAGLVKFKISNNITEHTCPVYRGINGEKIGEIGTINKQLIYDLSAYKRTCFMENRGERRYIWRQGIKHNLKDVLELTETDGKLTNHLGALVDIEPESLYQFYKSSDIFRGKESRYLLPVYQRDLKDTLEDLPQRFPKLHSYLCKYKDQFLGRKSSIFKNRHMFTLFGIGEYTHLRYKVAIGGLYSEPVFRLFEPHSRPIAVDDTSYMLSTNDYNEAIYLYAVLSLECTHDFLMAISHVSDKRRFSKDKLERILIPPMDKCPVNLLSSLLTSWSIYKSFSIDDQAKLREWLASWLSNEKSSIQRELFN